MKKCMPACEETAPFTTVTSDVYCNMGHHWGGWIVIQRNRIDSSVVFNKKWKDYEEGFGNLEGYFWYGLKSLHCLTQSHLWEMSIVFQLKNDEWHSVFYDLFSVGSASEEYPLTVGKFTGGISDWFASVPLNEMKFSTPGVVVIVQLNGRLAGGIIIVLTSISIQIKATLNGQSKCNLCRDDDLS